ncbi:MAG: GMC family oxidoreductase [Deltaproteobacteria bacterium]|nr:GMC family oxidoreductase [Deltaproteobacteria bacterium]
MGEVYEYTDIREDRSETVDVCVIGTGAGGATLAYELAAAGKSVVMLEAGGYYRAKDFNQRELEMNALLFVDGGAQAPKDGSITVLQGRCVGGSTTVNALVCFRTPDFVLEDWAANYGIEGYSTADLAPHFARAEEILSVKENTEIEINNNSRIFRKGCREMGVAVAPFRRNVVACQLSGFCVQGCSYDAKQAALVTYIPRAIAAGATLYADTEAEEILLTDGRASGVQAVMRDRRTGQPLGQLKIRSKIVILAAGAIQTPLLLLRNKIGNSSGQVGKNLALHPNVFVLGKFNEDIHPYRGALMGCYSDEWMHPDKGGILIEAGFGGPAGMSVLLPGFGNPAREIMTGLKHLAGWFPLVHDKGVGEVAVGKDGKKVISYEMTPEDGEKLKFGLVRCSEIAFAAGATEVHTAFTRPLTLGSAKDVGQIDRMPTGPNDVALISYHPQGSCRMGPDPSRAVVGLDGQAHDVPGLFITDASIFPTSVSVNTQIPTYGMATKIASGILADDAKHFG